MANVHAYIRGSRDDFRILAAMSHVRNQTTRVAALTVVLDRPNPSDDLLRGAEAMGARIVPVAYPTDMPKGQKVGEMYAFIQHHIKEAHPSSNPAWVWLVDDDVWPSHNCLNELLTKAPYAAAMGAHVVDIHPKEPAFIPGDSWKNEPTFGGPVVSPLLSGSCLLVRSKEFGYVKMYSNPIYFGDDLFLTGQISMIADRQCWFIPSAKALHVRGMKENETWRTDPIPWNVFRNNLIDNCDQPIELVDGLFKRMGVFK